MGEVMAADEIIAELRSLASEHNREGMARFGINTELALGISVTQLRQIAKRIGKNHELALELWDSGIHEARILASIVDRPEAVTEQQMETWAEGFNSWDIVDQVCGNLFDKTPFAWDKAAEWSERPEEFVKRAGFSMIAYMAVHLKKTDDREFERFFVIIEREASDDRNFVKKAVNWALRQIGKRSDYLRPQAIACAERIAEQDSRSARWIARDALKELRR
ncbi:MAG TPA: DNA alkylation repair protein [Actinomycetota bacterium]|jgi:3-methyladenine DNA glycosylase AlkD|nr:DNA alkylation repair protein [Actinomycetota bacterium]